MKYPKTILLICGLLLWAAFTRPLFRNFSSAIPYTDRQPQTSVSETIVPGDHIQLLYHFWLCRDMIAGNTPAFSNVYEFNDGDDSKRFKFDPYYIPFSLVYAAVSPVFGNAAGWNAAGLFSVLLGLFGIYVLARRYGASEGLAILVSLLATAHPYRWITLFGGSPTGFASGLVPWILCGLDGVVRDKSWKYGLLAGFALFFAYCSDLHVFYFGCLLSPFWCIFAFIASGTKFRLSEIDFRKLAVAFIPFVILALVAVIASSSAGGDLAKSTMADGRSMKELNLFSPVMKALFLWDHLQGISGHIFYGNLAVLFLLFSFGTFVYSRKWSCDKSEEVISKREEVQKGCSSAGQLITPAATATTNNYDYDSKQLINSRTPVLIVLLAAVVFAIILLSFGAKGPIDGLPIRIARKLIPKYKMIRQPMKILSIIAPLLAVLYTLLLAPLFKAASKRKVHFIRGAVIFLAVVAIVEIGLWFSPAFCRLPAKLDAYAETAYHASERHIDKPGALAVPMWPGDSHWSSIYEYGVMSSRLRLVNGYSPAVPADYFEGVFSQLETVNHGALSKEQIDLMLSRGIRYVLFHEQPYPAKVSPFPSSVALRRLLNNQYLDFLYTADGIWVFFVNPAGNGEKAMHKWADSPHKYTDFPASYHWTPDKLSDKRGIPGVAQKYRTRLKAPVPESPEMRYMILASGGGKLISESGVEVNIPEEQKWISFPFTYPIGENLGVVEGEPCLEHVLVAAGEFEQDMKEVIWPAGTLFHTGFTFLETGAVVFPASHSAGRVLYGPDLPFPQGDYIAELNCEVNGEGDFGAFVFGEVLKPISRSGNISISFSHDGMQPLHFEVHSHGGIRLKLNTLTLRKCD